MSIARFLGVDVHGADVTQLLSAGLQLSLDAGKLERKHAHLLADGQTDRQTDGRTYGHMPTLTCTDSRLQVLLDALFTPIH